MATTLDQIRTAGEAKLTATLAKLDKRHRAMVLAAIRQYGSVTRIPERFWQEIERDIENETAALLLLLMLSADGWTSDSMKRQGVAPGQPRGGDLTRYAATAAVRSQQLATSRRLSAQSRLTAAEVDARIRGEWAKEVRQSVRDAFDDSRRERDAITTSTDSITAGQQGAGERGRDVAAEQGREVSVIWITAKDAKVCPVCAPLDGTDETVWGQQFVGPPAHPRCRCHLYHRATKTANEPPQPRSRPAFVYGAFDMVGAA